MTHADNSSFLAQANARRHQAALSAAHHAIEQLQREGKAVSFSAIAQSADVSRGWLYRQDQIRDLISRLRHLEPPAARVTPNLRDLESLIAGFACANISVACERVASTMVDMS